MIDSTDLQNNSKQVPLTRNVNKKALSLAHQTKKDFYVQRRNKESSSQ